MLCTVQSPGSCTRRRSLCCWFAWHERFNRSCFQFLVLTTFSVFVPQAVFCQAEQMDIVQHTAPEGWARTPKDFGVVFSDVNERSGTFCILTVYASETPAGDAQRIFADKWTELIVKPFNAPAAIQTETEKANGRTTTAGASKVMLEDGEAFALLTVVSGFGKAVSVVAIFNDQSYLTHLETFLNGIELDKPAAASIADPMLAADANLAGKWAKSTSGTHGLDQSGNVLSSAYYKSQYDFRQDGSYLFKAEQWLGYLRADEYRMTDESGTYTVVDDILTVIPANSSTTVRSRMGEVISTRDNALETVSYTWSLHYFSGIDELNLVLRLAKETTRDGTFATNDLFPNSYLYSQKFQPEWRFD